jgi:hypothetical protein
LGHLAQNRTPRCFRAGNASGRHRPADSGSAPAGATSRFLTSSASRWAEQAQVVRFCVLKLLAFSTIVAGEVAGRDEKRDVGARPTVALLWDGMMRDVTIRASGAYQAADQATVAQP